ncbi:MAG: hypothetical protein WAN47_08485 [Nitrosotalea sp.]
MSSQVIMVQPSIAQTLPENYTQQGVNQAISGGNAGQVAPFGNYTGMYGMNSNGNMTGGYMMHHFGNMTGGYMNGGYLMHPFGNMTVGYLMHHFGNMTVGYMIRHFGNMTGNYGMNSNGNMTGGYMNGGYMMHHFGNMTGNYGTNSNGNVTASSVPQSAKSPEQQIISGVAPTNVSCPSGYGLVLNSFDSRPACISSSDISKFVARGWGHLISP